MKNKFYSVRIYVSGIKKRCRKNESHSFNMANVTLDTKDNAEAIEKMKEAALVILNEKMKEFNSARIGFIYCYENDDFITSLSFDDRNFQVKIK